MAKPWDKDALQQSAQNARTGLADVLDKGKQAAQQIGSAVKQGATNFWNNLGKGGDGVASYQDGGKNARPTYTYENSDFQKVYDNIMNRKDFSFDLNGDALYQQYKDMYTKQGQLGMLDAMGAASAATGGYGSSYAAAAGQQAYQQSLENLNAHVPELYQMALQKYQMEGDNMAQQYAMLADDRDFAYQRYRDDVGDWEGDRAFAYQQERDTVADSQWERAFNENNRQWQSEFDEGVRRYNQDFDRSVFESDRAYDRSVYESDRDYDRSVYENDRDYDRGVFESDRAYDRGVYEYDTSLDENRRQFDASLAEDQRQFNANYRLDKSQLSLQNKQFAYQKKKDAHDYRYDRYKYDTTMAENQRQFNANYRLNKSELRLENKKFAESIRQFEKEYGLELRADQRADMQLELQQWIAQKNYEVSQKELALKERQILLQYG